MGNIKRRHFGQDNPPPQKKQYIYIIYIYIYDTTTKDEV